MTLAGKLRYELLVTIWQTRRIRRISTATSRSVQLMCRQSLSKCGKRSATLRPMPMEVISYQMPAFKQHGILVYFAAWKKHIGLYPPISGDKALEKAVARYAGPKGNLQFPLNEPIPYDLIERIVKLRVKQDLAKAGAKRKKKSRTSSKQRASK